MRDTYNPRDTIIQTTSMLIAFILLQYGRYDDELIQ